MKLFIPVLGVLALSAATISITQAQTVTANFSAAKGTWSEVRDETRDLDGLIEAKKLNAVHDAVLNLRDSVRELRFGWNDLDATSKSKADEKIRQIDSLVDALHESADHNDLQSTVQTSRRLHLTLDALAGTFPTGVLPTVGPILATRTATCPTMRMKVDPSTAPAKVAYNGQMYYFCAVAEANKFKRTPALFAASLDRITFGAPKTYTVGVTSNKPLQANQSALLSLAIREQGHSALTTRFQTVHERLMHLIVVSDDLKFFAHEHPQLGRDGRFYLAQRFPHDGHYFLFADFTPADGANAIVRSEVHVGNAPARTPEKLVPDTTLSKIVDGVRVDLKVSGPLQVGQPALLTYTLSRNGQPVRNMVPYLGAMGHLMAISQNGQKAVHTHAVSTGLDPISGLSVTPQMSTEAGPSQTFKLEVPTDGAYKIWAQFGVDEKILTVPFTFAVAPSASAAPPQSTVQSLTISLPNDYRANAATVVAGKPLKLTFFLKSDAGCGNTVSVPGAKWSKTLQVGQKATLLWTPQKSGQLAFECGMGMLRGSVLVK